MCYSVARLHQSSNDEFDRRKQGRKPEPPASGKNHVLQRSGLLRARSFKCDFELLGQQFCCVQLDDGPVRRCGVLAGGQGGGGAGRERGRLGGVGGEPDLVLLRFQSQRGDAGAHSRVARRH